MFFFLHWMHLNAWHPPTVHLESIQTPSLPTHFVMLQELPRVCKAVIKAKGGYFEESQI
jgi:hypothetical protein